ncbi:Ger(x)C family spore germination protein [Abyssisolibacter fermentans]|uniref:Ger(x)C family spore germination protein n=1 Tax=Abyssisolibacter fermentans TaxID=1766203 RepID=UPI00082E9376|nr:Ger(x)C family spore germination protein [Abyssisolibacter fermentans]
MKKYLCLIIVFVTMLLCSSCRTKKDIEKYAMVLSTGYDYTEDDKYMLTIQVLKISREQTGGSTNGGGKKQSLPSEVVIYTSVGETINKAYDNLTSTLGQEPYFSHNKFIVIGEKLAQKGIDLIIDSNLRGHEIRPNTPVLVAKGEASGIIKQLTPMDTIPANTVENIIKNQFEKGLTTITNLKDIYNGLANKTVGITTGVIYLEKDVEIAHNGKIFRVEDTAIFKGDKLIGFLTKEESRAMMWIKCRLKSGDIVVNSPKNEEDKITLEILNSKCRINPIIDESNYLMKIHIEQSSNIVCMSGKYDPMDNYKIFEELEEEQNKVIAKEIKNVIKKVQKDYNVDIFNFGEIIHRKYPKKWKVIKGEWDEIFSHILFEVEVKTSIKRPGVISKPAY